MRPPEAAAAGICGSAPASACSPEAWSFARMDELWRRFAPLTPYGNDRKAERLVMSSRVQIDRAYDDAEAFAAFAARADGVDLDRLAYHLRRLPRLPRLRLPSSAPDQSPLDLVDLFQVKKFLANYRAAAALLDQPTRRRFGLEFESEQLARALDTGGSDPETFCIADAMHTGLGALRAAIAERGRALGAARAAARARAREELGLDFGQRDFLVVPNERVRAFLAEASPVPLAVEAHDAASCVVRLQDDRQALGLAQEVESLLAEERELEAEVMARLSEAVQLESARLQGYAEAVAALDLARARSLLAIQLGMVRPDLGADELVVEGARFLPCEWDCQQLELAYTPLDLTLREPAAVLFGSNMGGKTVALQSLLFLQTAAQAALFVPARAYRSSVYPWIDYVGELAGERSVAARGGLSGFGFEVRRFADTLDRARLGGAFLAFDELAETTSSAEAEAILSAAVEALAALTHGRSVVATHFRGVTRMPGVRYLSMMGLDRQRAAQAMGAQEPLAMRIRRINGLMQYRIVDESAADSEGSDATAIAALLGLDPGIVRRAEELYRERARGGRGA